MPQVVHLIDRRVVLTPRERELLPRWLNGKPVKQLDDRGSNRTLEGHIGNLRWRLEIPKMTAFAWCVATMIDDSWPVPRSSRAYISSE